jgi:hypothetical protein
MKESSHVRQHRAAQMQMCSILQDKGRITPKAFGGHPGCLFSVGDMGFFFFFLLRVTEMIHVIISFCT